MAAAQKTAGTTYPVIWLKQKYHEYPAVMRSNILETIASLPKKVDTVLVSMLRLPSYKAAPHVYLSVKTSG